jgi:hypothetical protein
MGIQINGQTDTISAVDGALTVSGAELPTVTNLNATGIVTASGFVGNITGNINATGVSTIATLNVTQSNPTNLNVSGVSTFAAGSASTPSISPSGDSNTGIFFPAADTIAFAEGGVEAARLDSSGRLGIGTINPTSLLHLSSTTTPQLNVQAPTGESQIRISSGTGNYRRILFVDSATTPTKNNFQIAQQEVDNSLHIGPSTAVGGFTFSGSTGLRIDASGRMTIPSQPAFAAYDNSATTRTSGTVIWNVKLFDRQNNYNTSTGRFTAPIDGVYLFRTDFRAANTSGGPILDIITSNGYRTRHEETSGIVNQYHQSLCMVCYMSANDYAYVEVGGGSIRMDSNQVDNFAGFLVG